MDERANGLSIVESINISEAVQIMNKINQFQQVIKAQLRPKTDFGIIPGTDKPTLLKPGAEKILMLLGVTSMYELIERVQDYDKGFFAYTVKCILSKDGIIITEGLGHCNSRERKFMSQKVDPYTIANTCLKMAKKRAQVDAVLTIASLSDVFTQDIEDMDIETVVRAVPKNMAQESVSYQNVGSEDVITTQDMLLAEAVSTVVDFGKYRGKTVGEIAQLDQSYVRWLAQKAEREEVRNAAKTALNLMADIKQDRKQETVMAKAFEQVEQEAGLDKDDVEDVEDDEPIDFGKVDIPF